MSCTWCGEGATWTTAKVETLKSHEGSRQHMKQVDIMKSKEKIKKGEQTEAQKTVESLNKAVMDKLIIMFKTVHAISLAGRPFSDYVWMSKLDQAKGLDIGNTYLNSNSAKEFCKFIAIAEMNKIADNLNKAKFVSIMSDGSTDSSVTEVEIVYSRISIGGVIKVFKFMN